MKSQNSSRLVVNIPVAKSQEPKRPDGISTCRHGPQAPDEQFSTRVAQCVKSRDLAVKGSLYFQKPTFKLAFTLRH